MENTLLNFLNLDFFKLPPKVVQLLYNTKICN